MAEKRTDGMHVLWENDEFILARETDQLRAYTMVSMLASLAPSYGQETMFAFFERHQAAIRAESYGLLYEKAEDGVLAVPVAYLTWAFLSRACGVIFRDRLRPLHHTEYNSGKQLWAVDLVAPLGHGNETRMAFETIFANEETYNATRLRDGKWRHEVLDNNVAKAAKKE